MRKVIVVLLVAVLSQATAAVTIHVPQDQPTIQAGIVAATDGDTVLVAQGHYFENIDFKGKGIVVTSYYCVTGDLTDIRNTIIDGSLPNHPDSASVVRFLSGEGSNSVINGFSITNGSGTVFSTGIYGGGIVCCGNVSPVISNNHIYANDLGPYPSVGGGIFIDGLSNFNPNANPTVIANTFYENRCRNSGVAVAVHKGNATIKDNLFYHNSDTLLIDWTGVVGVHKANAVVVGNTFVNNLVNCISDSPHIGVIETLFVADNLFYTDTAVSDPLYAIYVNNYQPVYTALSYNCFYGSFTDYFNQIPISGILDMSAVNANGDISDLHFNIYTDPKMCEVATGDYLLSPVSPCIGAASDGGNIGALGIGCCCQNRGNVDGDAEGTIGIEDLQYLTSYLNREGPEPVCMEEADVNGDGVVDKKDISCLARYLFSEGNPCEIPACP